MCSTCRYTYNSDVLVINLYSCWHRNNSFILLNENISYTISYTKLTFRIRAPSIRLTANKGWYDRGKCTWRYIQDMSLMVGMGKPGGGRSVISQRMQSQFSMLNFTFPHDSQIQRIFESILPSNRQLA